MLNKTHISQAFPCAFTKSPCQAFPSKSFELCPLVEVSTEKGDSIVGEAHVPFQVESQVSDVALRV